jgi:hypothetical protein
LQNGIAPRLGEALDAPLSAAYGASEFLPADTYQLTRYNYREPETAWRGFGAALSSQLDALSAPFVNRFLEESLKPYGIESARDFLRAAGSEIVTARLDDSGDSTVLVVEVRDREALESEVRKHLGAGARTSRVGDAELRVSSEEERGAASFVSDHLLMGKPDDVRRCLEARMEARTLSASEAFRVAKRSLFESAPGGVATMTDARESTRAFVSYFASKGRAPRLEDVRDETLRRRLAERDSDRRRFGDATPLRVVETEPHAGLGLHE